MNTESERTSLIQSESGQAAAFVALLLFFVFLGFAALAIDGAMTYSVRRNLQNVADASALAGCRVLANGGEASDALIEAENTISNNLGSWVPFVGSNPGSIPPSGTNIGFGDGLVFGIEVPGAPGTNVRVAVMRQVPTVLTQFFGRPQTVMNAKARCDSTAGGGLLPIAIQRYDGGTGGTMTDYVAVAGAPPYPSDSVTITIPSPPARYAPNFKVPVPCGNPPNVPDSNAGPCAGKNYAASDSNPGPSVELVGQGSNTNNQPSSMNGFVLLDIRNVAGNVLESYNGATGQQNTDKNISQDWIYQHGYPGPFPAIGSEIAILDGVSASFAPMAVGKSGYNIGDAIAAIVYDGYTWTKPSYGVTLQPTAGNGIVPVQRVTYTVSIKNNGNVPWPGGMMSFNLSLGFSQQPIPANTHVAWMGTELTPSAGYYPFAMWNVIDGTTGTGQLVIWNDTPLIPVTYLSGLNLIADSSLGLVQGAASNFGIGSPVAPDYTIRTDSGQVFILKGASTTANLISFGIPGSGSPFNAGPGCSASVHADVYLNGVLKTPNTSSWNNYFSSQQNQNIRIKTAADKSLGFSLSAPNGATAGSYTMRFTVTSPCNGTPITSHWLEMPLEIDAATNVSANRFVFIQGYAIFRIDYMDSNDVIGHAISPLYQSLSDVKFGLQPRLVPW